MNLRAGKTAQILVFSLVLWGSLSNAQTESQSTASYQESESDLAQTKMLPRPFVKSVIFGVGAGTLVGFVSMSHFKTNFRKNMDVGQLMRGMSYGLYGGIILGLYLTYYVDSEDDPVEEEAREEADSYSGLSVDTPGLLAKSYFGERTRYTTSSPDSSAPLFFKWKIRF